jgi:threonine synthase
MPQDAIIADTAWNTAAATNAYLGAPGVQEVVYDPRQDPGRATLVFTTTSPDGRQLPPRRAELYINRL